MRVSIRLSTLVSLLLVVCATACESGDSEAPAPPLVEDATSPTSLEAQVIRGTAEFGAVIQIAGAASVDPQMIVADPYTARWRATVGLAEGENALTITATDAAGNVSLPTSVTIVREPVHAESLSIRLSRSLLTADDASLVVRITAGNDEPVDLTGIELQVAVDGYPKAIDPIVVTCDAAGRADAVVTGLDAAGTGTIVVAATATQGLEATQEFLVDPGRPASVDLLLSDGITPPADDLTIAPATDVFASIAVVDAPANPIQDAPITLFTDAPDAFLQGSLISDLTVAGTWRVVALVSDTLISDVALVTVTPGPGTTLSVLVDPPIVRAGQSVEVVAEVTDAFGNVVPATITLASSDATAVFTGAEVVHTLAGSKTITASADLTGDLVPDLTATAALEVVPDTVGPIALELATATTTAGNDVAFQVADQFGNSITSGVSLTSDAPGALVSGGTITGLTVAGTFTFVATIIGTLNSDDATLTVLPGAADDVVLTPAIVTVEAGDFVSFAVEVFDAFGNAIDPASFTLATDAPAGSTTFTAPATYSFCAPGAFTVTADAGGPTATASVTVVPGAPELLSLSTTPTPAVITAGQTVDYATTVLDGCGNPTSDPVQVTTNAPGAIVGASTISGLTHAGSFLIVARVLGTPLIDDATLLVGADTTTTIVSLSLTSHATNAGLPIGYAVTAVDGFGNPISGTPTITVPTDAGATIDTTTRTIVFSTPGIHTVTATLGAASDSDFVVVTAFDATGPSVSITSPAAGTVVAPGSTVNVTVFASDDVALAQVILQATGQADFFQVQLAPGGTTSTTATFAVPVPGGAFGSINLIAQAVDTSGNRLSTPIRTITVDPVAGITTIAGFSVSTVTLLPGGNPQGITVFGSLVYIADSANDRLVRFNRSTSTQTLFPTLAGTPRWLTYFDGATDFVFGSATGPSRLFRIETTGFATPWTAAVFGTQRGVAMAGSDVITVSSDDLVRSFTATAPPFATPTCEIDMSGAGPFPGLQGNGQGIVFLPTTGAIVVTESNSDSIWRITATQIASACGGGTVPAATRLATTPDVNDPRAIVVNSAGTRLYFANRGDGRIMRLDLGTGAVGAIASGFSAPFGLAFGAGGDLLISDEGTDAIYSMTGAF